MKGTTDTIVVPADARAISYTNTDYTATLRRIFEGVQSKEDLAAVLGGGGGSVQLVNSGTVSSSDENFAIVGLSSQYRVFWVDLDGVLVDEASKFLHLRLRADGNSTPDSGATDYSFIRWQQNSGADDNLGDFSEKEIEMIDITGSTVGSNEHLSGRIYVYSPGDDTQYTFVRWCVGWTSGSVIYQSEGGGSRKAAQSDDALYLVTDSGTPTTFSEGNYRLYGIRQ